MDFYPVLLHELDKFNNNKDEKQGFFKNGEFKELLSDI